jgi:hypothetical protein
VARVCIMVACASTGKRRALAYTLCRKTTVPANGQDGCATRRPHVCTRSCDSRQSPTDMHMATVRRAACNGVDFAGTRESLSDQHRHTKQQRAAVNRAPWVGQARQHAPAGAPPRTRDRAAARFDGQCRLCDRAGKRAAPTGTPSPLPRTLHDKHQCSKSCGPAHARAEREHQCCATTKGKNTSLQPQARQVIRPYRGAARHHVRKQYVVLGTRQQCCCLGAGLQRTTTHGSAARAGWVDAHGCKVSTPREQAGSTPMAANHTREQPCTSLAQGSFICQERACECPQTHAYTSCDSAATCNGVEG